jgi:Relaxase/Mobilisation nuclease domain
MIFAASAVPSVTQTMNYVLGPGRDNVPDRAELLGGQGLGFVPRTADDVKLAMQIMEYNASPDMQASRTKKCTLTALHASASWEPSQRADQDEMLEAGRHFLRSVGMGNAMAIFHKHSDKRPHMHMVASMIDPKTGLTYDRYQFLYKAQHAAIEWEREKGQITPARQPQHDLARAARNLDWDRLQDLLRKKDGRIAYGKVNHALALGGHFGPRMVEHGVQFKKYLAREPERTQKLEAAVEQLQEPKQRISILDLFEMARDDDVYGHVLERAPKREKGRGLEL